MATFNESIFLMFTKNSTFLTYEDIVERERMKSVPEIIAYSVLFIIGAVGNLRALFDLMKRRHLRKSINLLMAHLTFADLLVVFISIPVEIIWRITVVWKGGLIACKVFQMLRVFGLYLSSFLIVSISIDRYYVFTKTNIDTKKLNKILLVSSWALSFTFSIPQALLYRTKSHILITNYVQCVVFGFWTAEWKHRVYNVICLTGMYFGPLVAICICYFKIIKVVFSKRYLTKDDEMDNGCKWRQETASKSDINEDNLRVQLNKTSFSSYIQHRNSILRQTKRRTLKMTAIIVIAFIICWSPYAFMVLWYQFHAESAQNVDPLIQEGLYIFAVANSCVNPFVYKLNLVKKLSPTLCVV